MVVLSLWLSVAQAAPVELSWSARLLDATGTPLSGSTPLELRLYSAQDSATPAWSDAFTPQASNGYVSVVLGSGQPLSDAVLASRPVQLEVVVAGQVLSRAPLHDVPYAAHAAAVSPAAIAQALAAATCSASDSGTLGFHAASNSLRVCDAGVWRSVGSGVSGGDGSASSPAYSCKQLLNSGVSTSGPYWIDGDGSGPLPSVQTHCDMQTRGGGWTLVAYLGTISGNKTATIGSSSFLPLFHTYGAVAADAHSTGATFSRLDAFAHLMQSESSFLAYRTSVANNQFIWPVSNPEAYRRGFLPPIDWMELSNDGSTYYTRANDLSVYHPAPNDFTGYDWNAKVVGGETNCDNCDNSFTSGLSHRGLLYWEPKDDGYSATQWFHAQPLSLTDSTGPQNTAQDIAIYLRE